MAAYLLQFNPLLKKSFGENLISKLGSIRYASGVRKSRKSRNGHLHGPRVPDNTIVKPSTLLAYQLRLEYCPGLNVNITGVNNLVANVAGRVLITCERTDFDTNNPRVQYFNAKGIPKYRTYYNVIQEPHHKRFKLVEKF